MQVDEGVLDEVVNRLRRVEGQVGGLIRMIEEDRDCQDVVIQLAAASKALDRAGFRILASGLRHCVGDEQAAATDVDTLERLFLALA